MYCTVCGEDTAVAMRSIFAKTDIACNVERWEEGTKLLDGEDYGTLGVIRWGASFILTRRRILTQLRV